MAFKTGLANATKQKDFASSTTWVRWAKDKEKKTLRFLTDPDEVMLVSQHSFITGFDGNKRTYVCPQSFLPDSPSYRVCELCAQGEKAREIGVGLAVLREEVSTHDDRGFKSTVKIIDQLEEYEDEEGNKSMRPIVGIVSQSLTNFWGYIAAINDKYGSLKDIDLEVVRNGTDLKTQYMAFPSLPEKIDLSAYDEFKPHVQDILERMASQAYYDKFLHGIDAPAGGARPTVNTTSSHLASMGEQKNEWDALREKVGAK